MEDNNNNERKKNIIVPTIIGVVTMVALIIGATFAYFQVVINNTLGNTTVSASTGKISSVNLISTNPTLSMELTTADMMKENNDIYYYATPTGKQTYRPNRGQYEIAKATISDNTDDNYYLCNYTLSIETSSTPGKSLYDTYKNSYANKTSNEIQFIINGQGTDWYNANMPTSYSSKMMVSNDHEGRIISGLSFANKYNVDQSALADKDVSITIRSTAFSCTATEEPWVYYTWNGSALIGSESTNYEEAIYNNKPVLLRRINGTVATGDDIATREVCGIMNGNLFCVIPNTYKENNTEMQARCTATGGTYSTIFNDYEVNRCSYGESPNIVSCFVRLDGFAYCSGSSGNCSVDENGNTECSLGSPGRF